MKLFCSIGFIFIGAVFLIRCAEKKIEYNLPQPMSDQTRAVYMERLDKGKTLYKLNCSTCHGIFTKGKDSIPNFTKDQINNYRAAVMMAKDQKNHAVAAKMSPQQLDYIIMFLSLRKHDN